jgi:stress response protein YsnF
MLSFGRERTLATRKEQAMAQAMNPVRLDEMRGAPIYDNDGDKIGTVEEIFYDDQTNVPEWIGIGTGFFKMKRVFVPVTGAAPYDDGLMVPYSKDHVKDSPDVDEGDILEGTETRLAAYYGVDSSKRRSDTGLPEGTPTTGRTGEGQAVTRSEEEIEVGTRSVEAGRARLRKWVETEPVALDVQLEREVARVTRERIDEPVTGHEFTEEEVEVPLHREKPVVQKETVAKERVGLEKDVQTEQQTVRDELKKERVEVEGDVDERRP